MLARAQHLTVRPSSFVSSPRVSLFSSGRTFPPLLLPPADNKTERESGRKAQLSNIAAAKVRAILYFFSFRLASADAIPHPFGICSFHHHLSFGRPMFSFFDASVGRAFILSVFISSFFSHSAVPV
jgi:hypothetical protein